MKNQTNAGGMARELAAQKPESTTDINLARVSREFKAWKGGRIIGIVDYYGAVHSRIAECGDDHNKHFGARMHKCWDFDDGRLYHGWLEDDDREAIVRHLARKYSIRENKTDPPVNLESLVRPGRGYRLLETGEQLEPTDEFYYHLPPYGWHPVTDHGMHSRALTSPLPHRRRIDAAIRGTENPLIS